MFSALRTPRLRQTRRFALRGMALCAAAFLAACQPVGLSNSGGDGQAIDTSKAVAVALLVPGGSGRSGDDFVAQSLERAARLAIADLAGVKIDLRVYNTAGNASQAQTAATQAVNDGAKIIIGPLYSEAANAAGIVAARNNVNILAFSNNPAIAGGNVFVLGQTFENTADRLVSYARRQGKGRIFIVNARTPAEEIGRDAIASSISRNGASLAGSGSFELSQQGLASSVPDIVQQAKSSGAQSIFFTSTNDGAMPFLSQLLPQNGLTSATSQFIGLARLDIPAQALSEPGLQGSWFALPDPAKNTAFRARYSTAYGGEPHALAGLAYDGIAAIGALVKTGKSNALTRSSLTQNSGFAGVSGVFRLRSDGTNQRGLAIGQIRNNSVIIIDPAPRSFGGAGF